MDSITTKSAELTSPQLPRDGIREIASVWSGEGRLLEALSDNADTSDEVLWTAAELRRRAQRVLLERLVPDLRSLPMSRRQWLEYLPITLARDRVCHSSPIGTINWVQTIRRYGWLPTHYIGTQRSRSIDEIPTATLMWVSTRLSSSLKNIRDLSPAFANHIQTPITLLEEVVPVPTGSAELALPNRSDLLALDHSGFPWRNVARIARLLIRAESDLEFLAFDLLEANSEVQSRLFHLSVFGSLVRTLRNQGCHISWNHPLGMSGKGPIVQAFTPTGITTDIWFDSGSSRTHYDLSPSLYQHAVAGVAGAGSALRSDILLLDFPTRALILECKWSNNPTYVARDGYQQAASYALDAMNGLAREVWSMIVGPREIVTSMSLATDGWDKMDLIIGSMSVESLPTAISAFLGGDPSAIH